MGRQMVLTSQPVQDDLIRRAPSGKEFTQCYMSMSLKLTIAETPGLGAPIPEPLEKVYNICKAPGKSLGMFAAQDLQPGDLILAERPFLIVPRSFSRASTQQVPAGNSEDMRSEHLRDAENMYKHLLKRLEPSRHEAFMSLTNSHPQDGQICGRIRTNAFASSQLRDGMVLIQLGVQAQL